MEAGQVQRMRGLAMGCCPLIPVQLSVWFPGRPAGITVPTVELGTVTGWAEPLERERKAPEIDCSARSSGAGDGRGLGERRE